MRRSRTARRTIRTEVQALSAALVAEVGRLTAAFTEWKATVTGNGCPHCAVHQHLITHLERQLSLSEVRRRTLEAAWYCMRQEQQQKKGTEMKT